MVDMHEDCTNVKCVPLLFLVTKSQMCFMMYASVEIYLYPKLHNLSSRSLIILSVCPLPHSLYYDASCYQIQSGYDTYNAAKLNCEALTPPHHLVVVNDAAEESFITGLISNDFRLWMGCTDGTTEGTWVCQDTSGQQWMSSSAMTGYWSKFV